MSARRLCRDKPGVMWFLSLMFVGVSLAFVYLGLREHATVPLWQSSLFILFGVAGTGTGIWLGHQAPLSTILLDEADGHLVIRRVGVGGRKVTRIPVGSIRRVEIEKRDDDEGYPMTRPALRLDNGESVVLSTLWRHGDVDTLELARHVVKAIPRLAGGDHRLTK